MAEPTVTDLIKQASGIPEYQQMMNYLSARKAVPAVAAEPKLPTSGVFRPGPTFSSPGAIGVRPKEPVEVLVHEMTHAADTQILGQYLEQSGRLSGKPASNQFTEAYDKLDPPAVMKIMAPAWTELASKYRSTRPESRAFAVENSITPKVAADSVTRAPAHVDATLATEFMILLELAQRTSGKSGTKPAR